MTVFLNRVGVFLVLYQLYISELLNDGNSQCSNHRHGYIVLSMDQKIK